MFGAETRNWDYRRVDGGWMLFVVGNQVHDLVTVQDETTAREICNAHNTKSDRTERSETLKMYDWNRISERTIKELTSCG